MIQVQINSKREFTRHLFLADTFDSFLLEEAIIKTANTYIIDGHVNNDYYSEEELLDQPELNCEFTPWSKMKSLCFDLIKGKKTPLFFKFVMHFDKSKLQTESSIKSYVLNIKFQDDVVLLSSGISTHTFQLDKSPEERWDAYLEKILSNADISYEHMI